MVVGLVTPTFAAGNLQKKFESANPVDVVTVATALGEYNDVTGRTTYVSAVEKTDHNLRIQAYHVNGSQQIVGSDAYLGGTVWDVDIARVGGGGHVVAAMQDDGGNLRLIAFDATSGVNNEEITRLGTKTTTTSLAAASEVAIVDGGPLSARDFVTAVRTASGDMRLDSWHLSADGQTFTLLDTHIALGSVGQIAMESDYLNTSRRFATAAQNATGNVVVSIWSIDGGNGNIVLEDSTTRGVANHFDLAFSQNRLYMVIHAFAGTGEVHFYSVSAAGDLTKQAEGPLPGTPRGSEIYDMGDGTAVVTLIENNDQLVQWTFTQSGNQMVAGSQLAMQRTAEHLDGTRFANTIFYAIEEADVNNLFHQLWTY
jgi:hypothetical protein